MHRNTSMSSVLSEKRRKELEQTSDLSLGPAPQDIFSLDQEISNIKQGPCQFSQYQVLEAKRAIEQGQSVDLKLSPNITPKQLIQLITKLGFDDYKLKKLFRDSSIVVKNLIESYVRSLHSKYQTVFDLSKEYENENDYISHSNALGYLFHTKGVTPLQCNESTMTAKVRINMNLNFENTVENDSKFIGKFRNELATNVFKCKSENIDILNVRKGSVIVVIGGISLIALAFVGIITLTVALRYNRHYKQMHSSKVSSVRDMSSNSSQNSLIINNNNNNNNDNNNSQADNNSIAQCKDHVSMVEEKEASLKMKNESSNNNSEKNNDELIHNAEASSSDSFVSSLFSKLKVGMNNLAQAPGHGYDKEKEEGSLSKQVKAENDASVSVKEFSQEEEREDASSIGYQCDNKNDDLLFMEDNNECDDSSKSRETKDDFREFLRLNIDDCVWVRGKNNKKLYAATVIGLTRNTVTIEYDNKPFTFINTETFQLDDERLSLREPGLNDDKYGVCIEGCVEIDSKKGGFVRIFQNNEAITRASNTFDYFKFRDRPVADI